MRPELKKKNPGTETGRVGLWEAGQVLASSACQRARWRPSVGEAAARR
jgi:hypothetical protein